MQSQIKAKQKYIIKLTKISLDNLSLMSIQMSIQEEGKRLRGDVGPRNKKNSKNKDL